MQPFASISKGRGILFNILKRSFISYIIALYVVIFLCWGVFSPSHVSLMVPTIIDHIFLSLGWVGG